MPDKVSYQQFASEVKAKYPQYKDKDDLQLTNAIINKYPYYKDKVVFEPNTIEDASSAVENSFKGYSMDGSNQFQWNAKAIAELPIEQQHKMLEQLSSAGGMNDTQKFATQNYSKLLQKE